MRVARCSRRIRSASGMSAAGATMRRSRHAERARTLLGRARDARVADVADDGDRQTVEALLVLQRRSAHRAVPASDATRALRPPTARSRAARRGVATSSGTPASASRITSTSTCSDSSVNTVSSMLSPLTREDSCTSRLTTSAPSRLAASSKETRVRVEGSVNRLATVTPASSVLDAAAARRAARTKLCARSSSASMLARATGPRASAGGAGCRRRAAASTVMLIVAIVSSPFARKPALQNHRRRGAVDVFAAARAAALAARALRLERRARLERGVALIDHVARAGRSGVRARRRTARAAGASAPGVPSALYGAPTTSSVGRERAHLARDGVPVGPVRADGDRGRGAAVRVSVSPAAMPIRLNPKSKARTVCGRVMPGRWLRMAGHGAQPAPTSMPSSRQAPAQRSSNGRSNTTRASTGTDSQALSRISRSSWPDPSRRSRGR